MHYSQRFLSQLTCNLDRYVQSTDFSFETSLLVASIDGTLSVSNLPRVAGMVQTLSRSSLRSALFSVRLFSQMESFPDQEVVIKSIINSFCILCLFTEDRISEVVSNSCIPVVCIGLKSLFWNIFGLISKTTLVSKTSVSRVFLYAEHRGIAKSQSYFCSKNFTRSH